MFEIIIIISTFCTGVGFVFGLLVGAWSEQEIKQYTEDDYPL
jgi:hypothetical protein